MLRNLNWSDILTISGTIASFVGAVISWNQANKAKTSASIVDEAIKEIKEINDTVTLNSLLNKLKEFEHFNINYITGPQGAEYGKNRNKFFKELQKLLSILNQEKSRIQSTSGERAQIDSIYKELTKLTSSSENIYDECLILIRDLVSIVTTLIHNHIYQLPLNPKQS